MKRCHVVALEFYKYEKKLQWRFICATVDTEFSKPFADASELRFFYMVDRLVSVYCDLVKKDSYLRDERNG